MNIMFNVLQLSYCSRWGFYGFMKDLFTAPDDVMCYLCENYRLHDIPLGNDWTEKNADKVDS